MPGTELAGLTVTPRPGAASAGLMSLRRARLGAWLLSGRSLPLLLAGITFVAFSPTLWNGFVEWDDHVNLFDNPNYRGLRWTQIRWMFTSTLMGHYIPVTWLSFGLDYTLWGMNPFGYHLTNTLLHAANAALFYLVTLRLLGRATSLTGPTLRLAGAMAALFFALHPLRAESVAWATERRDLLSGLFFLLTVLIYLKAAEAEAPRRRWLLAGSVALYLLGLLSKSIVMTLPLVLVLLDVYPLGRLTLHWRDWTGGATRALLKEKLPYFVLALAGAATSYWAVSANAYVTPLALYPWSARVGMTGYSLWFYFSKTALPIWLSPLYELPKTVDPLEPRFLLPAIAVIVITGVLLAFSRRWPAGLAVWVYYGIVLGPVTGIVHSGHQITNDRYSYLSCLGWALLFGAAVGSVAGGRAFGVVRPSLMRLAAAAAAIWILALGSLTWYQVQTWHDTETLWRYAIESDPKCSICHSSLGVYFLGRHMLLPAKEQLELAVALRPDRMRSHENLGLALASLGDTKRAIQYLRRALTAHPNDPNTLSNLAGALIGDHQPQEALSLLERAQQIKPDNEAVLTNLGIALTTAGQPDAALGHLSRAVELKPGFLLARLALARAYLALGNTDQAREQYDTLSKLDPALARQLEPSLFPVL